MDRSPLPGEAHQALHDPVTGLPNRTQLLARLQAALAAARAEGGEVALLMLDLDRFKLVNDSYGHATGEALLSAVAARLRRQLRADDTAARLNGDEFAIIMAGAAGRDEARLLAERLTEALGHPFQVEGHELYSGASVGIAVGDAAPEELLGMADTALHRAKADPNGRQAFYEDGMRTALRERIELERDLRRAIEREELTLAYQPIVDLGNGAIVAFEALARWTHPERGFVSPGEFIPLAEETGLIVPLGDWVMHTALAQLAAWRERYDTGDLGMSINISGAQLRRPTFLTEVTQAVELHGLEPRLVMLEITETIIMEDTEASIAGLEALRDHGFSLAIDDFGTGYSSLQYVRRFPVDVLKVAKPFVDGVAHGRADAAVAAAVVQLGRSLDLRLIAEGIEHAEQHVALSALGCQQGQGYHFARPMSAPDAGVALAVSLVDQRAAARGGTHLSPRRLTAIHGHQSMPPSAIIPGVARSVVQLPAGVSPPFTVYVNGVPQTEGSDYVIRNRALVFERALAQEGRLGFWRWALGAIGIGTYRPHHSVDVRYELPDGRPMVADALPVEIVD
jgi:diguanylate cyclase (GGDEF)-like protein